MKVLTVSQIRAAEENAVLNGTFSYAEMMFNAGSSAAKIITEKYNVVAKRVAVVCGVGNNGGDGFCIADILSKLGAFVTVITPLGAPKTETAAKFFKFLPSVTVTDELCGEYDIIIDALFGIGLDRTIAGRALEAVDFMNISSGIKIAIDLPSGIMENGKIAGKAFLADLTITFIAMKMALLLPPASDYCGDIEVADIGVIVKDFEALTIEAPSFKKRAKNSHKGTFGTGLIIGGSYGMCGAEILAARAALRSGIGLVKSVVTDKNYSAFCTSVPEAVTLPVKTETDGGVALTDEQIENLMIACDAVLIGPGMSGSFSAKQTVIKTLNAAKTPVVLDADGINAIAFDISILRRIKVPVIITPHPAEMARLCGVSVSEIQNNRVKYARNFSLVNGVITVLKGANTIVAAPDGSIYFNTTGNAGMATGGSGDVLSGIILSLLAQGFSPLNSALYGVFMHGRAGDIAASMIGEISMLPSDIIANLNKAFK